jgi:hypothetical protein
MVQLAEVLEPLSPCKHKPSKRITENGDPLAKKKSKAIVILLPNLVWSLLCLLGSQTSCLLEAQTSQHPSQHLSPGLPLTVPNPIPSTVLPSTRMETVKTLQLNPSQSN